MSKFTASIQKLYVAYFNRPADAAGLAYWDSVAVRNDGIAAISAEFARSAEYKAQYAGMNPYAVVDAVYQNLFGHAADEPGKRYWGDLLAEHGTTIDRVVTDIAGGAQGADKTAYDNKAAAAQALTDALNSHPNWTAYAGNDANAVGRAWLSGVTNDASLQSALANIDKTLAAIGAAQKDPMTIPLTVNADTGIGFTGGSGADVFSGTGATFSAGDQLDGGAGRDVLSLTDDKGLLAGGVPAGVRLTSIEGMQIDARSGNVGSAGKAYDVSGFAGLFSLGVRLGAGELYARVADGAAVEVINGTKVVLAGSGAKQDLSVYGTHGPLVVENATAGHTLDLRMFDYAAYDTAGGDVTDATAGTVNLTVLDERDAPLYSQVIADGYDHSNVRLDAKAATALNVNNHNYLYLHTDAMAVGGRLASVSLAGAGATEADFSGIESLRVVDATAATGTNTVAVSAAALENYRGGIGSDRVTVHGSLGAQSNVALGAGDDVLRLDAAIRAGAHIDGGAGVDRVELNEGALLDAAAGAALTGFETLGFSGGAGAYDLSRLTGLTRVSAESGLSGDVALVNAAAGTALDLSSRGALGAAYGKVGYALRDATGAQDALSLNLIGVDTGVLAKNPLLVTDLSANGIETISIESTLRTDYGPGTWWPAVIKDAASFTHTIAALHADGAKQLTLTGIASIDIIALDTQALAKIDASSGHGNVSIGLVNRAPGQGKLAYLGSAGIDKLAAGNTPVSFQGNGGDDEVSLGNGADTVVYARASDSRMAFGSGVVPSIEGGDTVRGFAAGVDKLDLSDLGLANGYARGAMLSFALQTDSREALAAVVGAGTGFFRDAGGTRALAWVGTAGGDGYLLVDIDGNGSFDTTHDMGIHFVGGSPIALGDVIFGV